MRPKRVIASILILNLLPVAALSENVFIAGVNPSIRPENAPVITQFVKDDAWQAHALSGVDQPYPDSLKFLEDQGAWFNPFIRAGMTGPYDIRNWH